MAWGNAAMCFVGREVLTEAKDASITASQVVYMVLAVWYTISLSSVIVL